MYVNPFWFGVLCTIIFEIVVGFILAFISVKIGERSGDDDDEDQVR